MCICTFFPDTFERKLQTCSFTPKHFCVCFPKIRHFLKYNDHKKEMNIYILLSNLRVFSNFTNCLINILQRKNCFIFWSMSQSIIIHYFHY